MAHIYILGSTKRNNWHYVGSCREVKSRIKQHNKGSVRSTKAMRPLELIYHKSFDTVSEARKYELFLKSPRGYLEKQRIIKVAKEKSRDDL